MSKGITMRNLRGSANAPTPSGISLCRMLVSWKAEWVS